MSDKKKFNIAVIGAGPGGYVAAIKAAQLGKKVALIEKEYLGGTCLNVGCIPSKTLIAHASLFDAIKHAEAFGIHIDKVSFDFAKMKQKKDTVLQNIRKSLESLIKSNSIAILRGTASFLSPKELKIRGEENLILSADSIIIATGSDPLDIPAFPCDHVKILNSTSILSLEKLPKSLAIIGGGYIGCEFASLYSAFGVKVTILEALPSIISAQGKTLSEALTNAFQKKGIEVKTHVKVTGIEKKNDMLLIHLENAQSLQTEMALIAVGRKIVTQGLQLEKTGISTGQKGEISVNEKMETDVPGIYAIGDVTGIAMLAHVASHQGIVAASNACGVNAVMHYEAVPAVIFTEPEIATVGMTEEEAQKKGYAISIGRFPFQALGKAQATGHPEGFAQIIADKKTGQILGGQVFGHEASSLISEIALAIANELTLECIIETIHAHPTLPEAWLEAALLANETPIHFPPKFKKG